MTRQRFQEALDYLYQFIDYSVERRYRYSPEVFDLGRVANLLKSLGDPHRRYPSAHIAGTKGKGSVAAMMASCLTAAGYRTGLYTSPHLLRFTERIMVDGEEISEEALVRIVERMKPHVEAIPGLTTYELITALGFSYFADRKVDCAVIEVGLGGRLDATNVITPLVSVITSLSYDHMYLLGESLSDIAREKAGIIKPGVPVVIAPQQFEAERVLETVAEERRAPLVRVGNDWLFAPGVRDLSRQTLYIWSAAEQALMDAFVDAAGEEEWAPPRFEIPLLGYHQVVNAAVAYAALRVVTKHGLPMSEAEIREGFRSVVWPGRFQILSSSPALVVDSAHNRDSALKLRIALDDYFPGRPVTLIFGVSSDKDISGMLAELAPRVSRLIATQAVHPRAEDPEVLADLAHSHGLRVEVVVPVSAAVERALSQARLGEVILAAGSLFVAGEVLAAWDQIRYGTSRDLEGRN